MWRGGRGRTFINRRSGFAPGEHIIKITQTQITTTCPEDHHNCKGWFHMCVVEINTDSLHNVIVQSMLSRRIGTSPVILIRPSHFQDLYGSEVLCFLYMLCVMVASNYIYLMGPGRAPGCAIANAITIVVFHRPQSQHYPWISGLECFKKESLHKISFEGVC